MPSLKNPVHERFARLVSQGMTQREAYSTCVPDCKSPQTYGCRVYARLEVRERVAELKSVLDQQFALLLGEKRDLLRRMALGEIPTKVTRRPGGKLEATFDRLAALQVDARLAGEFAPEKLLVEGGPSLKLEFDIAPRDKPLTQVLEAELVDLGQYEQADIRRDAPQLEDLDEVIDEPVEQPDEAGDAVQEPIAEDDWQDLKE